MPESFHALVVENGGLGRSLKPVLHDIGIRDVVVFVDPADALNYVRKTRVDVIITEPMLGGEECNFAREFRLLHRNTNPFAPILMIVNVMDSETIRKAIENCMDGVLVKPFEPRQLRERIDSLIEVSRSAARMLDGHFDNRPRSYDEPVNPDRLRGRWA